MFFDIDIDIDGCLEVFRNRKKERRWNGIFVIFVILVVILDGCLGWIEVEYI